MRLVSWLEQFDDFFFQLGIAVGGTFHDFQHKRPWEDRVKRSTNGGDGAVGDAGRNEDFPITCTRMRAVRVWCGFKSFHGEAKLTTGKANGKRKMDCQRHCQLAIADTKD